jgi:hypothetical protein
VGATMSDVVDHPRRSVLDPELVEDLVDLQTAAVEDLG